MIKTKKSDAILIPLTVGQRHCATRSRVSFKSQRSNLNGRKIFEESIPDKATVSFLEILFR
jgi:hypothetical protein